MPLGGTSQPQKRTGFEYARTTEKRMIARSCQPEQSQNILQFRRDLKFAPKCAQCRLSMALRTVVYGCGASSPVFLLGLNRARAR
jgi:hypothetical protein